MNFNFWNWKQWSFYSKQYFKNAQECLKNNLFLVALGVIWFVYFFNQFSYYLFLFSIPYFLIAWKLKLNLFQLLGLSLLALGIASLSLLSKIPASENYLRFLFKQNSLHQILVSYNSKHYGKKVADFINLLVLSHREYGNSLYFNLQALGVVHLIVVSGLHLNFLYFLIAKLLLRKFWFGHYIAIVFLIVYWSAINFSYPGLRAVLSFLLLNQFKSYSNFFKWSFISLLSFLFNFKIYLSLSYILSYGAVLIINVVTANKHLSKTHKVLGINLLIFIFVNLIIMGFTKHLSVLAIFNAYLLFPIIMALFVFFLFFFLLYWIEPFALFLVNGFHQIINWLYFNKARIPIPNWHEAYTFAGIFSLIMFLIIIALLAQKRH